VAILDKFLIIAPATFPPGTRLGLSQEQAVARSAALLESGKGVYLVQHPVQFKAGEVIGFSGELPKALGELVDKPKAKRAARPVAPEAEAATPGESPAE
jgi:hypothetical protein